MDIEANKESSEYFTFTGSTIRPTKDEAIALKILEELEVGREIFLQQPTSEKSYTVDKIDWFVTEDKDIGQPEDFYLDHTDSYIKNHILSIVQEGGDYSVVFKFKDKPHICLAGHDKLSKKSFWGNYFLKVKQPSDVIIFSFQS